MKARIGGVSANQGPKLAISAAQAAIESRFLGGRPPYGYTLADAGPHPQSRVGGQRTEPPSPVPSPRPPRSCNGTSPEFVDGGAFIASPPS